MTILNGTRITLGVSGGIAAYKAADLASKLVQAGATVDVLLTKGATEFIQPLTFQAITESGSSDPRLMANGISQAMIATVLGLGIAIPLLFANAILASLSRTMVQILDEQSTGILAESLEKRRRA